MAKPHLRIADCRDWLTQADPVSAYVRRAKLVLPSNPEVWYLAGVLELRDGRDGEAWADWKRSLAISPEYLPVILQPARPTLTDEQIIQRLLPDRAETLIAAASLLYPDANAQKRRPFLQQARAILRNPSSILSAQELHRRGEIEAWLGEDADAASSYEAALQMNPRETGWRYQYAVLLHKQGA